MDPLTLDDKTKRPAGQCSVLCLLTHIPAVTIAVRQYRQSRHMIHFAASISPVCIDYKAHFTAVNTNTHQSYSHKKQENNPFHNDVLKEEKPRRQSRMQMLQLGKMGRLI